MPTKQNLADNFELICQLNPDLKLELSRSGELVIVSPTGGETGRINANLIILIGAWNLQYRQGVLFDSSTCFRLPNGAIRSPDVSWIRQNRWDQLTQEQKLKFPPLAPDFVIELLSPSDSLGNIQAKMQEYLEAGVKLGWLINPNIKTVEIYQPEQNKLILNNPTQLSGEDILIGLNLDFKHCVEQP